jgi:hypothetical protein
MAAPVWNILDIASYFVTTSRGPAVKLVQMLMLQRDEHALVNSLTVELRKEYANMTEYRVIT